MDLPLCGAANSSNNRVDCISFALLRLDGPPRLFCHDDLKASLFGYLYDFFYAVERLRILGTTDSVF